MGECIIKWGCVKGASSNRQTSTHKLLNSVAKPSLFGHRGIRERTRGIRGKNKRQKEEKRDTGEDTREKEEDKR